MDTELNGLPNPFMALGATMPLAQAAGVSIAPAPPLCDAPADTFPRGFCAEKFLAELELFMVDREPPPAFLRAPSPEYIEATIASAIGGW